VGLKVRQLEEGARCVWCDTQRYGLNDFHLFALAALDGSLTSTQQAQIMLTVASKKPKQTKITNANGKYCGTPSPDSFEASDPRSDHASPTVVLWVIAIRTVQCPLWVRSDVFDPTEPCPLFPQ